MDIRDLIPQHQRNVITVNHAFFGQFATHPIYINEEVYVILPDVDMNTKWGPCFWQSRDAISLPEIGDKCLVMFDNRRIPWVVAWWPFTTV